MVVMLTASLVSSCKVKVVEEEVEEKGEEKGEEKEMEENGGIEATTVKVSDVDIETKM